MATLFPSPSLDDSENMARLSAMWARVQACDTLQGFDALWLEWVGYSMIEDSPDATAENIRADLVDYIKEFCYDAGIYCGDIIDDVDDDTRSNGPHYKG